MNDDPVDVDRIIHSRRFAMEQHMPGWVLPLNDGHRIAWLRPMDYSVDDFMRHKPITNGWGVWLADLPGGGWRNSDLPWSFSEGPFRTRREAMAYALTLGS